MLFQQPERFDCTRRQSEFGPGDFWILAERIEATDRTSVPLSVRTASLWQDGVQFYTLYADNHVESLATDHRGVAPLIQLGALVEYPIMTRDSSPVRLLWRVENAANIRGILLGPRLSTEKQSDRSDVLMTALYASFAGLAVSLILYNLALWAVLRHSFQLYYCAMVLMLAIYTFSSSGLLVWVFPEVHNNDRLRLNYTMLGFTAVAALLFARSFFEKRVFAGWLNHYSLFVCAVVGTAAVTFFFVAPISIGVADAMFGLSFLCLASVVFPTVYRAWAKRSNYLWVFVIAWSVPIAAMMLRTLAGLRILDWNFWLDNATVLSMIFEALVSSVAIAYRMRQLRDERDDAIAKEVMARRLADIDPLTGLLNRRAFLARALGREGEQQLTIADLDHFKRINDTIGHDGGDEVLRQFARVLRSHAPSSALIARMGGEEFAIISSANNAMDSDAFLSKLRTSPMPFDIALTASVGVCRGPMRNDADWKKLYRGADRALLKAKSDGRDRVRRSEAASI